ncbi:MULTISPECIES: DegV family protein [unclassified Marinitoga]|uniref:DegV family protein n=1 Tax=unclassified Marinitoga TaxID=2640159 RepID=UPI000640E78F|nr:MULTISPECIES: DegV family protein [unclassified Marinitoga]KLO23391.1 6-phosphogluconate dehydratase [Marinitoga sp. 1155]NUV00308.1 6-phosphogluconate dehydratase [Marinitoga sp. 1154]
MENVGIIVDSGTDLPEDIIEKYNIKVVPLRIIINDKEYEEGSISEEFLLQRLEDSDVKTSLPKPEAIIKAVEEFIEKGINKIMTFNISGSMSGTYNLFKLTSESLKSKYPELQIENIDTLNISIGAGLVAYQSIRMLEEGKTFEEVANWAKNNAKKSKIFFIIPSLKYLAKGGRIGRVSAKIGKMLNIKPIISNSDDGIYYTVSKVRGLKKAYNKVYDEFLKFVKENEYLAAVYISGVSKEVEKLQSEFYEKINHLEHSIEVFVGKLSSTLTIHAGPDMFGIGALIVE